VRRRISHLVAWPSPSADELADRLERCAPPDRVRTIAGVVIDFGQSVRHARTAVRGRTELSHHIERTALFPIVSAIQVTHSMSPISADSAFIVFLSTVVGALDYVGVGALDVGEEIAADGAATPFPAEEDAWILGGLSLAV
jgi:hypothetical protein